VSGAESSAEQKPPASKFPRGSIQVELLTKAEEHSITKRHKIAPFLPQFSFAVSFERLAVKIALIRAGRCPVSGYAAR
jgi:hypothetical protein